VQVDELVYSKIQKEVVVPDVSAWIHISAFWTLDPDLELGQVDGVKM
jgi:hypothetical protein